jgi:hypothetical protein
VAVGLERAHAEFLGEGEGLEEIVCCEFGLQGIMSCRHVAEEAQGIGLVATFLVRTGKLQRLLGEGLRLLQMARQHLCLPQGECTECLIIS